MNFKYLGLGSLLGVVLFAVLGATVVDRITYFSSTSVSKTNYVSELVVTNGATLGGVRRTSWPTVGADSWTNASSRVRLTTTNANNTLELSADDGAGAGTIEFFTAGSRRWLINNGGVLYPESNSDIGTSVNPVQSLYLGPVGIHIGTNVLTTDLSNPTKPTWNNGVLGNVTSTGASVAGQFPTYTGTDGKSVVPTNGVPLLNVGTLTFTGGAANVVPVFDGSTNIIPSQTTTNELDHVHGVTSAIQTQINAKAPTASPTFTGTAVAPLFQSSAALFGAMGVNRTVLTQDGSNGDVLVDLSSTNRFWLCYVNRNPVFVLTNSIAGNWANLFLVITNVNCTPTFNFPASTTTNWFGGAPSTLTAGTFGSLSYYPISSDTNATKACYVETQ